MKGLFRIKFRGNPWKKKLIYVTVGLLQCVIIGIVTQLYVGEPFDWNPVSNLLRVKRGVVKLPWTHLAGHKMEDLIQNTNDGGTDVQEFVKLASTYNLKRRREPLAVIFVMSLPHSSERRDKIRETWSNPKHNWRNEGPVEIFFFIGIGSPAFDSGVNGRTSTSDLQSLEGEIKKHKDIILIDHKENYYNLPMKVIKAMKYFVDNYLQKDAPGFQPYFVKTDDDVFINIKNLVHYLKTEVQGRDASTHGFIGGYLFPQPMVNRDLLSKFYMPEWIWPDPFYPAYVGGFCYIISGTVIQQIYRNSLTTNYLPFEDTLLIGLVANLKLGLNVTNIPGMYDSASMVGVSFQEMLVTPEKLCCAIAITAFELSCTMVNIFAKVNNC